ncbi:FAD/NAD(P)-binding domain-containing protein [Polyplosphaeria fusca]|uniref:FAD/NAD(P)-binding domain-containing protein n=1 Tax=Polyplosphaeria fusca TaxID=682080 RepID=A0A9P4QPW2_9PLEO|nr:FAD/NAD(P)-binding domain-containing protein [Polyplosphaeria fusca]
MSRYLFAWALALHIFWSANAWPTKQKHPVCIIGAGPAGLTAASRLEAKGIKSVIFDKQEELGGKCQAYYDDQGIFHPLGAAFFSNASYPDTVKVIDESGVSIEPFELTLAGSREQFWFNYTAPNGDIQRIPPLTQQFTALFLQEIPRYVALWQTAFAPYSVTSFKKGVPEELTVSGAEWFRANNFTAMPIVLVNPLALYGYGDINIVPALYVLQYITPDILTAFIGRHNVYYTDFHKVWTEWAKKKLCKTPINLAHEIRCIDRSGDNPVLRFTRPQKHNNFFTWEYQTCSRLIFAFPPTIENLERAGLDLTEQEQDVFKDVGYHNYYSSAIELELPFGVSYIARSPSVTQPPPNDGQPVAVLHLDPRNNISTSWSWGPSNEFQSERTARDLLDSTMSKLNKDPRNVTAMAEPFGTCDVLAFRKWDYFPHFGSEALRCGAYGKLNALQGVKKSYWASGLNGMETVEWAVRAGIDVVESYF